MSDELHHAFPLFPLGLVALPEEMIPLHISEERYKQMINHCLQDGSEFGIVWMADDGLRDVGCACAIEEVLETTEDGRINLVARGTRPFWIAERESDLAYPAGTVQFLEDRDEPPESETAVAAREVYAELVRRATDHDPEDADLASMTAYGMAATVDFGVEAKQGLLELRSENARMALVTRLFRAAFKRLDFVDRAQARARSNGKVRF